MDAPRQIIGGRVRFGPDRKPMRGPDGKTLRDGGREFAFGMMSATDALKVQVALLRALGEPMLKAIATIGDPTHASDAQQSMFMLQAASALTARMDAKELTEIMELTFSSCTCAGQPITMDLTFGPDPVTGKGRRKEVWTVFVEALKVNLGDFFDDALLDSSPSPA